MGLDQVAKRPRRMSVASIVTGESIEAQFNPTELEEAIEVKWGRPEIPGLSHQPMQFGHTGNDRFSFDLNFDALDPTTSLDEILSARRFLLSLCYPGRGASSVTSGGPARVLFVWPNLVSLTCVLTTLGIRYHRFNSDGTPIQFTCRVSVEEIRDVRLFAEDVRDSGTQRSSAGVQEV